MKPLQFIVLILALVGFLPGLVTAQEHAHDEEHSDHVAQTDAAHAAGEDHAAAHGHDEEYSIWSDLPFWSGLAFIGFLFAISKLGLWDLMVTSMSDREKAELEAISIAEGDLSRAKDSLREARGRLEAMDETIRETIAEAERDASYTRDEITRSAEREAQAAVARAQHEIDRVRGQSLQEIFSSLADKVTEATESRLKSGLQSEDQERLINSTLDELAIR